MAPDQKTDEAGRVAEKLGVVRTAARHRHPTADIDEMLAEIESGHESVVPPKGDA